MPSWTHELFTVTKIQYTSPVTYLIKDDRGESLQGSFYEEELQKVGEKDVYKIEAILDHRLNSKKKKEYLVKWLGYNDSFNEWIPQSSLLKLTTL